jgi:hypothetical protein
MNRNTPGLNIPGWGVLLVMLLLPSACGFGDDGEAALPAVRHPIATAADQVAKHLNSLSGEDSVLIGTFRKTATPELDSYEVRQVCGALGRALATADAETVADFVLDTHEHLYAEFFAAFDADALTVLANSLRVPADVPELTVLSIEFILREAQGAYSGTLHAAAREVPFLDAVAPRPMPVEWLKPGEDAPREVYTGAAAALRSPACVEGGARSDLALEVYRRALLKWPGDPVFISGMASLLIENEGRSPRKVMEFLAKASEWDSENAAWLYLTAARHFRTGMDAKALAALSSAAERPHLSFYGVDRAQRTSAFLTALGYSPVRARVVACRLTSNAAVFDLKLAGSKALLRTYEYEELESCRVLLELPLVIKRQLGDRPRLLITEQILLSLLASGLPRLADLVNGERSGPHADAAVVAEGRLTAIENGEKLCGGLTAWGQILTQVGDEAFVRFLDLVLSGGEARYLEDCAGEIQLDGCLKRLP